LAKKQKHSVIPNVHIISCRYYRHQDDHWYLPFPSWVSTPLYCIHSATYSCTFSAWWETSYGNRD